MSTPLILDGSHGEGGGQILRTALSLSAITGRPLQIENIRANRPNPGLAAQHLTAVNAAGALCGADMDGNAIGSTSLQFFPGTPVRSGDYTFDVGSARVGGSAGSCALVFQAILLPLALAIGNSRVVVHGGTHIMWSPVFDYVQNVWLPALAATGIEASITLNKWGWYPAGGGEIAATIHGLDGSPSKRPRPVECRDRGSLRRIYGRAVAANLPSHIAQRMADRARAVLATLDVEMQIAAERVRATCPGAGIFLTAEYEHVLCGFGALGERGKPAETVAEEACSRLHDHHDTGAALDRHLADQMILPLALASGDSVFTTDRVTRHLATNAWVVEQFEIARIGFERLPTGGDLVIISPHDMQLA